VGDAGLANLNKLESRRRTVRRRPRGTTSREDSAQLWNWLWNWPLQSEHNCSHKQIIGTMQLWLQNEATGQILTRNLVNLKSP
jgi:hypothetical protein